jgi:tRNA dimethylallyltransferase
MKLSTKQYAKRQISWIRNKLIPAAKLASREQTLTPFYLLDATGAENATTHLIRLFIPCLELAEWTVNVQRPAVTILEGEL